VTYDKPTVNPWLIALAVMLATFMEVLDTSIAAVALPYIAGSLSATNDEATWVLTSYLVANAVSCPRVLGSPCVSGENGFFSSVYSCLLHRRLCAELRRAWE
jgi:MFS family permease